MNAERWTYPRNADEWRQLAEDLMRILRDTGYDVTVHGPVECLRALLASREQLVAMINEDEAANVEVLQARVRDLARDLSETRTAWADDLVRLNNQIEDLRYQSVRAAS